MRPPHQHSGFTLFEVLGVVFVTAITIGFATDFYIDLSRASVRASASTREIRRSTSLLDRVARDFESAILVAKPAEVDPLSHPWLFVGESRRGDEGADHIKFVTRNFQPRRSDQPQSDLMLVAYTVRRNEDDESLELLRWTSPRLPESLDRSFPSEDDEAAVLLAEGLASFGVRFFDAAGEATDRWDSTTLVQSGQLPAAIEINVALADLDDPEWDASDATVYKRWVRLPVQTLDLAVLLDPSFRNANAAGEGGEDGDEDGEDRDEDGEGSGANLTVADCLDIPAWVEARNARVKVPAWARQVEASANLPWNETKSMFPSEFFQFYLRPTRGCR